MWYSWALRAKHQKHQKHAADLLVISNAYPRFFYKTIDAAVRWGTIDVNRFIGYHVYGSKSSGLVTNPDTLSEWALVVWNIDDTVSPGEEFDVAKEAHTKLLRVAGFVNADAWLHMDSEARKHFKDNVRYVDAYKKDKTSVPTIIRLDPKALIGALADSVTYQTAARYKPASWLEFGNNDSKPVGEKGRYPGGTKKPLVPHGAFWRSARRAAARDGLTVTIPHYWEVLKHKLCVASPGSPAFPSEGFEVTDANKAVVSLAIATSMYANMHSGYTGLVVRRGEKLVGAAAFTPGFPFRAASLVARVIADDDDKATAFAQVLHAFAERANRGNQFIVMPTVVNHLPHRTIAMLCKNTTYTMSADDDEPQQIHPLALAAEFAMPDGYVRQIRTERTANMLSDLARYERNAVSVQESANVARHLAEAYCALVLRRAPSSPEPNVEYLLSRAMHPAVIRAVSVLPDVRAPTDDQRSTLARFLGTQYLNAVARRSLWLLGGNHAFADHLRACVATFDRTTMTNAASEATRAGRDVMVMSSTDSAVHARVARAILDNYAAPTAVVEEVVVSPSKRGKASKSKIDDALKALENVTSYAEVKAVLENFGLGGASKNILEFFVAAHVAYAKDDKNTAMSIYHDFPVTEVATTGRVSETLGDISDNKPLMDSEDEFDLPSDDEEDDHGDSDERGGSSDFVAVVRHPSFAEGKNNDHFVYPHLITSYYSPARNSDASPASKRVGAWLLRAMIEQFKWVPPAWHTTPPLPEGNAAVTSLGAKFLRVNRETIECQIRAAAVPHQLAYLYLVRNGQFATAAKLRTEVSQINSDSDGVAAVQRLVGNEYSNVNFFLKDNAPQLHSVLAGNVRANVLAGIAAAAGMRKQQSPIKDEYFYDRSKNNNVLRVAQLEDAARGAGALTELEAFPTRNSALSLTYAIAMGTPWAIVEDAKMENAALMELRLLTHSVLRENDMTQEFPHALPVPLEHALLQYAKLKFHALMPAVYTDNGIYAEEIQSRAEHVLSILELLYNQSQQRALLDGSSHNPCPNVVDDEVGGVLLTVHMQKTTPLSLVEMISILQSQTENKLDDHASWKTYFEMELANSLLTQAEVLEDVKEFNERQSKEGRIGDVMMDKRVAKKILPDKVAVDAMRMASLMATMTGSEGIVKNLVDATFERAVGDMHPFRPHANNMPRNEDAGWCGYWTRRQAATKHYTDGHACLPVLASSLIFETHLRVLARGLILPAESDSEEKVDKSTKVKAVSASTLYMNYLGKLQEKNKRGGQILMNQTHTIDAKTMDLATVNKATEMNEMRENLRRAMAGRRLGLALQFAPHVAESVAAYRAAYIADNSTASSLLDTDLLPVVRPKELRYDILHNDEIYNMQGFRSKKTNTALDAVYTKVLKNETLNIVQNPLYKSTGMFFAYHAEMAAFQNVNQSPLRVTENPTMTLRRIFAVAGNIVLGYIPITGNAASSDRSAEEPISISSGAYIVDPFGKEEEEEKEKEKGKGKKKKKEEKEKEKGKGKKKKKEAKEGEVDTIKEAEAVKNAEKYQNFMLPDTMSIASMLSGLRYSGNPRTRLVDLHNMPLVPSPTVDYINNDNNKTAYYQAVEACAEELSWVVENRAVPLITAALRNANSTWVAWANDRPEINGLKTMSGQFLTAIDPPAADDPETKVSMELCASDLKVTRWKHVMDRMWATLDKHFANPELMAALFPVGQKIDVSHTPFVSLPCLAIPTAIYDDKNDAGVDLRTSYIPVLKRTRDPLRALFGTAALPVNDVLPNGELFNFLEDRWTYPWLALASLAGMLLAYIDIVNANVINPELTELSKKMHDLAADKRKLVQEIISDMDTRRKDNGITIPRITIEENYTYNVEKIDDIVAEMYVQGKLKNMTYNSLARYTHKLWKMLVELDIPQITTSDTMSKFMDVPNSTTVKKDMVALTPRKKSESTKKEPEMSPLSQKKQKKKKRTLRRKKYINIP